MNKRICNAENNNMKIRLSHYENRLCLSDLDKRSRRIPWEKPGGYLLSAILEGLSCTGRETRLSGACIVYAKWKCIQERLVVAQWQQPASADAHEISVVCYTRASTSNAPEGKRKSPKVRKRVARYGWKHKRDGRWDKLFRVEEKLSREFFLLSGGLFQGSSLWVRLWATPGSTMCTHNWYWEIGIGSIRSIRESFREEEPWVRLWGGKPWRMSRRGEKVDREREFRKIFSGREEGKTACYVSHASLTVACDDSAKRTSISRRICYAEHCTYAHKQQNCNVQLCAHVHIVCMD